MKKLMLLTLFPNSQLQISQILSMNQNYFSAASNWFRFTTSTRHPSHPLSNSSPTKQIHTSHDDEQHRPYFRSTDDEA